MIDAVSKGGNFLLNIGPTGEGVIPDQIVKQFKEIGEWMKVNGEAIYGTQRSPFGAEYGDADPKKKDSRGRPVFNVKKDWRCTTKPSRLYFHLFTWPKGKFELSDVKGKVARAHLLADPTMSLDVKQVGSRLTVGLPSKAPDPIASVLCLEIND